jgi:hypothetical protein
MFLYVKTLCNPKGGYQRFEKPRRTQQNLHLRDNLRFSLQPSDFFAMYHVIFYIKFKTQ